jgi:universal stress protein E
MKRFKRILYAADRVEQDSTALERAFGLAKANGAALTVLQVAEPVSFTQSWLRAGLPLGELEEEIRNEQAESLRESLAPHEGQGVEMNVRWVEGTPFIEVIRQVLEGEHDLVIKLAEGRKGPGGRLVGSTDMHLLRKCPAPVWLVRPERPAQYARILAAVDPVMTGTSQDELNTLILDLATSLATQEGSELHIVHAWELPGESMLRSGRRALSKTEVDQMVRETRDAHEKALARLVGKYDLSKLKHYLHLLKGRPSEIIRRKAADHQVELIVMGTIGRTGIPGFFIGNTAENLLGQVECSVLTVKPSGFITPVKLAA